MNVGAEFGGPHYAAVLDDNTKTSGSLMVLPLSSLDEGENKEVLDEMNTYLGVISDINGKEVFARIAQPIE